jgi:FdhD protein
MLPKQKRSNSANLPQKKRLELLRAQRNQGLRDIQPLRCAGTQPKMSSDPQIRPRDNRLRLPPRSVELTQVTEWEKGRVQSVQDSLVAEEPLEIRIDGAPVSVTMRTPGHDAELAAGFLFTEGIIESREQLVEARQWKAGALRKSNRIDVHLKNTDFEPGRLQRSFFAASSCGICGKSSIEAIRRRGLHPPDQAFRVSPETLCSLPEVLRTRQPVFDRTGGIHAAALFDGLGELIVLREDIGRHNAVDKLVGWALLTDALPASAHVLLVSGRGGFEIVQKALVAGIPVIACVSAPSSLAVQLARELGATLIGFLRGERFVVYSGGFRCLSE